jgi:hypothetical protein
MSDVRRPVVGTAAAAMAATLCLVGLSACRGDGDAAPTPTPSETSTSLADLATDTLVVRRDSFCSDVDPDAVQEALGGEPDASSSYGNGEPARLAAGVRDVAHEFGCTWRRADGAVARAWVFTPPVTPGRARALARDARTAAGCSPVRGAPAFGRPSAAVVCRSDGALEASFHGLFGDAWLSCSLAVPAGRVDRADLVDRTGRWCVAVATAASSQPQ